MSDNLARKILWPDDTDIVVRVAFLYVGQGDCAILLLKDGDKHKSILVDINLDKACGGIDVPALMKDLLADEDGVLDVFANTHAHDDHLRGLNELSDVVDIQEVWHTGYKPGKDHDDAFQDLSELIKKVGNECVLRGSRTKHQLGEAEYYVLAPADHVAEEIDEEGDDAAHRRIHEYCAVMKFGVGEKWIMFTGDADRNAWETHITEYHESRLSSTVLSAAHHGSRTFFHYDEKDDPYIDALESIAPTYVTISAPTSEERPHGHPHAGAVEKYAVVVGDDNVLHTGEKRECFICDIYRDGELRIESDDGQLVEGYPLDGDNDKNGNARAATKSVPFVATRVDERPMGRQ